MRVAPFARSLLLLLLAAFPAACSCSEDPDPLTDPDAAMDDASSDAGDDAAGDGSQDGELAVQMSIFGVSPGAASRSVDTTVTIAGHALVEGATVTLTNCDTTTVLDVSASVVVAGDGASLTFALPVDLAREQGLYTVTVSLPNGQSDELECAFGVSAAAPPTVASVTPNNAWQGAAGDGSLSDPQVTIGGAGFVSTPTVRFQRVGSGQSFEVTQVGFLSETELTAIVPAESLKMPVGDYHVFVVNPDLLAGQWMLDATTPGIFTVSGIAPPSITGIDPLRVPNGSCTTTTLTVSGGFVAGTTLWYLAPGSACAGATVDPNGNTLCPLAIDSIAVDGSSIEARFDPCPTNAWWPIVAMNPDGQVDYFYSVEVRPSSEGHLNTGAWETTQGSLVTARWKHATNHGFDAFGNAYLYVVGGQGTSDVVDTVEIGRLAITGSLSNFEIAQQFQSLDDPRVANIPEVPRHGATLLRVGSHLYLVGGAAAVTDTTTSVPALASVEHATILSYDEMPGVRAPAAATGMLPRGTWYYRVSAVGGWGESLAAREVVARDVQGGVKVCWNAPAVGAGTAYNIYRSLASDGRSGTAVLVASVPAGGDDCFTDDGTGLLAPAPGRLRGTLATGGSLAAGTYAYRVSAVVTVDAQPHETLAGYASETAVAADGNQTVALAWEAVPGATEYRVYRRDVDGSFERLDTGTITGTSFADTGIAFAPGGSAPRAGTTPLPAGSLSAWTELDGAQHLTSPREGLDGVVVLLDPATNGGLVARLLVAGGRTSNVAGYLTTAESIGVNDDGTLEASGWTVESAVFNHARAFYALVTTQDRETTAFPPPASEPPCGDLDGDGFVDCACAPPGTPTHQLDCNDADAAVHPGAAEMCGDGVDQDCDAGCGGTDLACECTTDEDGDGAVATSCGGPDCNDGDAGINPGAVDACGNGVDEDCYGGDAQCSCSDDSDGDGHVAIACGGDDCCDTGAEPGFGCTADTDDNIYPGAPDYCDNGIDEDCNGEDPICKPVRSFSAAVEPEAAPMSMAQPSSVTPFSLLGDEPVYVVAVYGDDAYQASANAGTDDVEACLIGPDGHLACGATWVMQNNVIAADTHGADALLYFDFLYGFYAVQSETTTAGGQSRTLRSAAIKRFDMTDPDDVTAGQLVAGTQSASTSFLLKRSYYRMERLLSYVYVVGGWTDGGTLPDSTVVPAGPTATVERHSQ